MFCDYFMGEDIFVGIFEERKCYEEEYKRKIIQE